MGPGSTSGTGKRRVSIMIYYRSAADLGATNDQSSRGQKRFQLSMKREQMLASRVRQAIIFPADVAAAPAAWRRWRRCAAPHHASDLQFAAMETRSTSSLMIFCLLVSIRKKLAACALPPLVWSRHRAARSRPSLPRCCVTAH